MSEEMPESGQEPRLQEEELRSIQEFLEKRGHNDIFSCFEGGYCIYCKDDPHKAHYSINNVLGMSRHILGHVTEEKKPKLKEEELESVRKFLGEKGYEAVYDCFKDGYCVFCENQDQQFDSNDIGGMSRHILGHVSE